MWQMYSLQKVNVWLDLKKYEVMLHCFSSQPNGDSIYVLEVELLETNCHVLDPTPLANCTVRPKLFTVRLHIEALILELQEFNQM